MKQIGCETTKELILSINEWFSLSLNAIGQLPGRVHTTTTFMPPLLLTIVVALRTAALPSKNLANFSAYSTALHSNRLDLRQEDKSKFTSFLYFIIHKLIAYLFLLFLCLTKRVYANLV